MNQPHPSATSAGTSRPRGVAALLRRRAVRGKAVRLAAALLALPLGGLAALGALATPAQAVVTGAVSPTVDANNGFPVWYQDGAGNRIAPCLDPTDPNCVVLAAPGVFDPQQPVTFPTNFPPEFFYSLADSSVLSTNGCGGLTVPGKAFIRLAVEGTFVNVAGTPTPGEQMTFGRIRVKVTSGLCPNTRYHFVEPYGDLFISTNAAGGIPANQGTTDVGCIPAPPQTPCDFSLALNSPLFGTAASGGFLRSVSAPAGYLGDAVTPTAVTGGTNGNEFHIYAAPAGAAETDTGLSTTQFVVSGKEAGPLAADPVDFAGVTIGQTSAPQTVTVTNLGKDPIAVNPLAGLSGTDAAQFAVTGSSCVLAAPIARDGSCTFTVTLTPAGQVGPRTGSLDIGYGAAGVLHVALTGHAVSAGAAATASLSTNAIDFGSVRLRTLSPVSTVTVTNTGDAPLVTTGVALTNGGSGSGNSQFVITSNSCRTASVAPGGTCSVGVQFVPSQSQASHAQLEITSNSATSVDKVALDGIGTGGVAAVSSTIDPETGFPDWYRDETGAKLQECIDKNDPFCVVLPDSFYDPARPISLLDPSDPTHATVSPQGVNFPAEFFYTVTDSEKLTTPGCNGGPTGSAFIRMAIEGAFPTAPTPLAQITFGRIRIVVRGGLCPNTPYTFHFPYGTQTITTNGAGSIPPNAGTDDVGCGAATIGQCDFTLALSSRVLGGFLRWDPAVAPAAPAGYLGDAVTLHKIVGAPFTEGGTPANYFKITTPNQDGGEDLVGSTNQFTVMGKLRGPLEPTGGLTNAPTGLSTTTSADFGAQPQGSSTATKTITYTNTGVAVPAAGTSGAVTVTTATVTGVDAADFTTNGDTCTGAVIPVGGTCQVGVVFSPTAVGDRSAVLTINHDGLNSPTPVALTGIGGAIGSNAAISFQPRSVSFAPLKAGRTSASQTVVVSNAGGTLPLTISAVTTAGASPASFAIASDGCTGAVVQPGNTCTVDVAFTPQAAGAVTGLLRVTDNAPGGTHDLGLSGTGVTAPKAVAPNTDVNGFPRWYQDDDGTRLEPCLSTAEPCTLLADAGFDPTKAVSFPGNFPSEFFYALADSELIPTDGCGGQTTPSTAMLRVSLEGSFANGTPIAGDQTTFTRVRIVLPSGLCPTTPYNFETPYGVFQFTTNANGGFGRAAGSQDTGCAAAPGTPCNFADALVSPGAIAGTPIEGFLRWNPNVAPAAPAGYLGDAVGLHQVVGGTYIPQGQSTPINKFQILDLAGNAHGSTDRFIVTGKAAGPLQTATKALTFPSREVNTVSPAQTVTLTNVFGPGLTSTAALSGLNASEFRISSNTCNGPLNLDASCQVQVTFNPTTVGTKAATLTVTPSGLARPVTIALTGTATPVANPSITATPGVLAFGTVVFPGNASTTTTIANPGTAPLVISAIAFSGAQAGDYARTAAPGAGSCGALPITVQPGQSCTISVTFTPGGTGARTGSMTLTHNVPNAPTTVVSLTGTGAASTIALNNTTLAFSNVNQNTSKSLSISIRNSGATLPVTVGVPTFANLKAGTPNGMWTLVNNGAGCVGTTLQPGKSCNISVQFLANAAKGTSWTGTLQVRGDSTTLPQITNVSLSATVK